MPNRAERRRAQREAGKKEWTPFVPPTTAERLVRHTESCPNCKSGQVEELGCEWLTKFYARNSRELNRMLGAVEFYDKQLEESE